MRTGRGSILRLLVAALAVGALAACGADDDGATEAEPPPAAAALPVELSEEQVAAGETIEARVRNRTDETFLYGQSYEFEREVGGTFERVELPDRVVIQIAHIAEPGELGPAVPVEIPADAEPGRWRVIIQPAVPGIGDVAAEFEVVDE